MSAWLSPISSAAGAFVQLAEASSGWVLGPFPLLLLAIAILPLLVPHFWERAYPWIAGMLGALVSFHYGVERGDWSPVVHALLDYASFMVLLASLYVISGGIWIQTKGEATPLVNTLFLGLGALLANLLGTTGASMLLIRPWIRMNRYRVTAFHIVFFIFIVSNVGGCLTPIGDPPLFVGFLKGVPFWWPLQALWKEWALTLLLLLGLFLYLDRRNFQRAPATIREQQTAHETFRMEGTWNGLAALGVSAACFLPSGWREGVMALLAWASWRWTPVRVHEANGLQFSPLHEVAWLFAGIFLTMIPAVEWLQNGASSGLLYSPSTLFWATGAGSAVLDNAPTYVAFLAAAAGAVGLNAGSDLKRLLIEHAVLVKAVSLGSVFFGAFTYIGNGPNLMVKQIAERERVHVPGMFGYVLRFALPILLPIYWMIAFFAFSR